MEDISQDSSYYTVLSKISTAIDCLDTKTSDESFDRPTRVQIVKAAKTMSHEITKIALLLQNARAQPEFFSQIESSVDNLFSIFQGMSAHSGISLFRYAQIHFRRVLKSLFDVLVAYKENEDRLGEDEENFISKERIGIAWKSCELLEKVPIRNSTAIAQRLEEIFALISDAYDEIDEVNEAIDQFKNRDNPNHVSSKKKEEVVEEEEEEDEEEDGEQEEEEDLFEDEAMDSSSMKMLTAEEMNAIATIVDLVEMGLEVSDRMAVYVRSLEPEDADDLTGDEVHGNVEFYEEMAHDLNELSKTIDDVVSAIYPPQNALFITGSISYLETRVNNINKIMNDKKVPEDHSTHKDLIDKILIN
eukprot:gene12136-14198_t